MTYIDLGTFQFTTGQDYTGLNTGNLSSVFDTNVINVPYFEIYRLVIDTSSLPATSALPAVVQTTGLVHGTSLTTLNMSFSKATTAGNTIVVGWSALAAATNPALSGITLGGAADNFAAAVTQAGVASKPVPSAAIWVDPNTGQAATAIVATSAGGSGAALMEAQAWEISNAFSTSTAAAAVDVTSVLLVDTGFGQTSFATAGPATGTANDLQIGFGMFPDDIAITASNPQGWTAAAASGANAPSAGNFWAAIGASNNAGPAGSSGSFQANVTDQTFGCLVCASLLPSATPVSAVAYPFSVRVGQAQWDIETTVAGVGYTYNIGQSPLSLNTGKTVSILWTSLPFAQYGGYSKNFKVTAYCRYDPAAQRSGVI